MNKAENRYTAYEVIVVISIARVTIIYMSSAGA